MIEVTLRTLHRKVDPVTGMRGDYYEETETVQLVTVERVDGLWKAVLWDNGELRVVPAGQLDEWTAED